MRKALASRGLLAALSAFASCDDEGTDADADSDADSDADADTDSDTDTDAETDADPDAGGGCRLWVEFETGQPPGTAGPVRGRAVYIWIEDLAGGYVDTVQQYHGRVTPGCPPTDLFYSCSGFRYYDDPCVDWHGATGETAPLASDPVAVPDTTGTELVVDGVTGASALPLPGGLPGSSGTVTSADWDCRDSEGRAIEPGDYVVQIEITWERADGLGHTRPCETYPDEFPCAFRYSAVIGLGGGDAIATIEPSDWMLSSGTVYVTAR